MGDGIKRLAVWVRTRGPVAAHVGLGFALLALAVVLPVWWLRLIAIAGFVGLGLLWRD